MQGNTDNNWASFSDIMTGLMVIFLFISISYMKQVNDKQETINEIFEEWKATQEKLYSDLDKEFKDDFKDWKVLLDKDLSIKFTNPDVLFSTGKSEINQHFKNILDNFLPRYFDVLLKEKYRDKIAEIRIEGHTDDAPIFKAKNNYIGNLKLSQERSASVMNYFVNSKYYKILSKKQKDWLNYHLTANGLSFGRTLDKEGKPTYKTKKAVSRRKSRRVEFRIVTNSEKVIEETLKNIEK